MHSIIRTKVIFDTRILIWIWLQQEIHRDWMLTINCYCFEQPQNNNNNLTKIYDKFVMLFHNRRGVLKMKRNRFWFFDWSQMCGKENVRKLWFTWYSWMGALVNLNKSLLLKKYHNWPYWLIKTFQFPRIFWFMW